MKSRSDKGIPKPYKRKGVTKTCQNPDCGKQFYIYPSEIGRRKFCSWPCSWVAKDKPDFKHKPETIEKYRQRTGKNNPNYKHGLTVGLRVREFGLKTKAEPCCRVCGRKAEALHHAVPRRVCPIEAKWDIRNGLPLCHRCHVHWHRKLTPIYRDVFTPTEWAYISTLELTGREITGWLDANYPVRPAVGLEPTLSGW